ncbi:MULTISPECIES: dihydromethanopterin reductase (acceptor) [unclassified Methanosarcina]|uniref:dihydromethanopterin reductase (acceptor) n=1 Tax=unclassified Methanosarcina TaxID=2644672 RepID=UPI0006155FAA|nr:MULTISPECIES: dihydromethanopterin reductase (acceptor) [unclassified Methanosarcina]AKB17320.1 bifunctional phosphopantothenoylcysteine decarboxylase/phosphopantothenate synthase [Methanosarcina sp. WWM596]AKB20717.1 bifunctional phosphopantothenoylcysteine decarboxylase/phosphopantothenate synthase [Methanosarcina sp. WH1]
MSFKSIAWGITGAGHFLDRSYQVFKELKLRDHGLSVNTYISRAAEEVLRMYGLEQKLVKISGGDYLEEIFRESEQGSSSPKVGRFLLERYDALFVTPATSNTVSKIAYGIADSLVTNAVAQAVKGRIPVYVVPVDIEGSIVSEMPYNIDRKQCRHCEDCPPRANCPHGAITEKNGVTDQIELLKCKGCGICKELCSYNAIKGGPVEVLVRDVDMRNVEIVKKLQGITVLESPEAILELF